MSIQGQVCDLENQQYYRQICFNKLAKIEGTCWFSKVLIMERIKWTNKVNFSIRNILEYGSYNSWKVVIILFSFFKFNPLFFRRLTLKSCTVIWLRCVHYSLSFKYLSCFAFWKSFWLIFEANKVIELISYFKIKI